MFSNSKNNTPSQTSKVESVIGKGTVIDGNIKSTGTLRIDGRCIGDISTDSDVIIGEAASINGDVYAVNVSLAGRIEGNVKCSGVLDITLKGTLIGDVEVGGLSVQNGAVFSGKCNILSKEVDKLVAAGDSV